MDSHKELFIGTYFAFVVMLVSILVVMDSHKEHLISQLRRELNTKVSILVVMDSHKERNAVVPQIAFEILFQSLL